jgi:hypothetical protein
MSILTPEERASIAEVEKTSRFPTGIGRIDRDECPQLSYSPVACTFCLYGHMLECHYPKSCKQAQCSHLAPDEDE